MEIQATSADASNLVMAHSLLLLAGVLDIEPYFSISMGVEGIQLMGRLNKIRIKDFDECEVIDNVTRHFEESSAYPEIHFTFDETKFEVVLA